MPELTASIHIAAAPAAVFAICSDFEHAPQHVSAITKVEMLTPGPTRQGTRFKETRKMFGKEATETMEVLEFTPNSSFVLGAESCGTRYRTTFTFTPTSGGTPGGQPGTTVEFRFLATPLTFFAKVMGAIMMPFMKNMMRKCVMQDLQDVKKRLEAA